MPDKESTLVTIAILGGTGKEGAGLAKRWALNGYRVIIGSRDPERAASRAAEMNAELGGDYLTGMVNADAARAAGFVVVTVPYQAHKATLESVKDHLQGKVLVDVSVPLNPPAVRTVHLPEGGAAALEAQALVGDGVTVIAAFQNVSAYELNDPNHTVETDVLVCGDDKDAKSHVMELVKGAGMRGVDAGSLANAIAVEALTPVLLYINKAYKVKGAGIHITGID
jgi:8-hydroxy-5-deazaflavin:NADPH oxidoreductase